MIALPLKGSLGFGIAPWIFQGMVNVFDNCTDSCGWVAALIAALAYGSFGVPVKATKHIDVHPLVLQSYKTVVVFMSCWLVLLFGVEVSFTKWGLLSGLLWVIGGTGGMPWWRNICGTLYPTAFCS